MIRLKNVRNIDYDRLKNNAYENYKGNFDLIFHPQNKEDINYNKYYEYYQMKSLIVVSNLNEERNNSEDEENEEEEEDEDLSDKLFIEIINKNGSKKIIKEEEINWYEIYNYIHSIQYMKKKTKIE